MDTLGEEKKKQEKTAKAILVLSSTPSMTEKAMHRLGSPFVQLPGETMVPASQAPTGAHCARTFAKLFHVKYNCLEGDSNCIRGFNLIFRDHVLLNEIDCRKGAPRTVSTNACITVDDGLCTVRSTLSTKQTVSHGVCETNASATQKKWRRRLT